MSEEKESSYMFPQGATMAHDCPWCGEIINKHEAAIYCDDCGEQICRFCAVESGREMLCENCAKEREAENDQQANI